MQLRKFVIAVNNVLVVKTVRNLHAIIMCVIYKMSRDGAVDDYQETEAEGEITSHPNAVG